ncbi:nucleotidyltransferase family protein [Magnetospirillum sulfuroxidans]|uniref:Nucleotidyltransferase family protein n=1 Tax=Magnetospirillum sulfuroxidans TaxID=611300 RepID=A0ABS5IDX9_9PROT|nr:nucleotidyltransferase family protein [Magnetospirillum sulfuroxidans]MBR9972372.1 nucleotidyltransferase family protein [Magnetospirillum sulfuroxidans]
MSCAPTHAMVLAAGLGLRMRPITATIPKPLVAVAGRTMLDRALDHLDRAAIPHKVVNAHWLPEKIAAHVAGRTDITLSLEAELLETGGGVALALPLLGTGPFYVVNSDIIWTDGGGETALRRLAARWDDQRMDALLLMQRTTTALGYDGQGDFFLSADGVPSRRGARPVAPLLFSGVQILSPRLFRDAPAGKFSLNRLYDRALEENRLFGLVHDGHWYHVGTPEALPEVEQALAQEHQQP